MTGDECPACGCLNLIGVEYHYGHKDRYDGISEWRCPDCGTRTGRWSGRTLRDGESEPRFGGCLCLTGNFVKRDGTKTDSYTPADCPVHGA